MLHLIVCHNIFPKQHHKECTAKRAQVMLMLARLELFDLSLFIIQTMRTEVQSASKEGLPYGSLLTQLIVDVRIDATRYEPTSMQLGAINSGTCQRLMMKRRILHAVEKAVVPIISSLAAMEKRLEKIESMQLELKKTNDEGWKDIMHRDS
ncbi:hypothetical protein CJ030_MR1G023927 [Morella rubra]|uniref:Uncharacterized protein n=1 Tax=Morella rubra TaxID=262757 RepID=A0A6A1WLU5_9ROSI|nr:hypothetical protein CJ030_MR1G023927 [Morella rubra]